VGAVDRCDVAAAPESGRVGRQPIGVPRMLPMYCLQQRYGLADEALEDVLHDKREKRPALAGTWRCSRASAG
jgi:hypothetical protein